MNLWQRMYVLDFLALGGRRTYIASFVYSH